MARGGWLAWAAAGLLALVVTGGQAATWEQQSWGSTVYYRATFRAADAGAASLAVAAADSFEVFLNGVAVASDSTARRARSYLVTLQRLNNHLAVRVVNRGTGAGSGLLAVLSNDSLRVQTTANAALQAWYWTDVPQSGTAWTTAAVTAQGGWQAVQGGTLDPARVEGWVDTLAEAIAGYPGGIETGGPGGGATLAPVDGINLALGRFSNRAVVTDGDVTTSWDGPVNAINQYAAIDLGSRRRVHAVRVITRGKTAAEFDANALRGYSVQVSDDEVTWAEVAVTYQVPPTQYAWSELQFAPVLARHVRVVVVAIDPTTSPRVAEIAVLGTGPRREGCYLSPVIPAGALANLGRVFWEAAVPGQASVALEFRAGLNAADFADSTVGWSAPLTGSPAWFPAAEPARLWQYRARLSTDAEPAAPPVLKRLRVFHDEDLAVTAARGWVLPDSVPMGVDTTFTYRLNLEFGAAARGVQRLEIATPSPAQLDPQTQRALSVERWESAGDRLTLYFAPPLVTGGSLEVPFRARTLAAVHSFRAFLYSPDSDNPLNVAQDTSIDPSTGRTRSWSVVTTTSLGRTLAAVRANPPVLTPNGDGVNDDTVIEFALAKVAVAGRVRIGLYDLGGRAVRRWDCGPLGAGAYVRPPQGGAADCPGYWDGTDATGRRVAPGIYLYRIEAQFDAGGRVAAGAVSVAY